MSIFIPFIHFGAMGPSFIKKEVIPFCKKHELIPDEILSNIRKCARLRERMYLRSFRNVKEIEEFKLLESKLPFSCHARKLSEDTRRAQRDTSSKFWFRRPRKRIVDSSKFDKEEKPFLENYYANFLEKNGIGPLEGIEERVWEEYIDFSLRDAAKRENYVEKLENHVSETLQIIATDDGELFDEIDVKFDLGNGIIYSEIRAFWAVHSEVFRAMLFGKMQESQKYSVIPLENVTTKTMDFLKVCSSPFSFLALARNLFYRLFSMVWNPTSKRIPKKS